MLHLGLSRFERVVKFVVVYETRVVDTCICVGGQNIYHSLKDEFNFSSLTLVRLECLWILLEIIND